MRNALMIIWLVPGVLIGCALTALAFLLFDDCQPVLLECPSYIEQPK